MLFCGEDDRFLSSSMFAIHRKWHPLLRAPCCLRSSETASGHSLPVFFFFSFFFLLCFVWYSSSGDVCMRVGESALPIQRFDLISKRSNQLNHRHVSLCLCATHTAIQQLISPAPKLLDWVKTVNSCWWPTRCGLWTKSMHIVLCCQLLCTDSADDAVCKCPLYIMLFLYIFALSCY